MTAVSRSRAYSRALSSAVNRLIASACNRSRLPWRSPVAARPARHSYSADHLARPPRAQLRPGETVLVQAGGSGVGSAGLQIAKLWGATVYTTVGSAEKATRAKAPEMSLLTKSSPEM